MTFDQMLRKLNEDILRANLNKVKSQMRLELAIINITALIVIVITVNAAPAVIIGVFTGWVFTFVRRFNRNWKYLTSNYKQLKELLREYEK